MVRTKLVLKRKVRIRQWPPKEPYVKFKIKTLLPEQKTIQIKKNGQVIRTVTVRRKTKKFKNRSLGKNFLRNVLLKRNVSTVKFAKTAINLTPTKMFLKQQGF